MSYFKHSFKNTSHISNINLVYCFLNVKSKLVMLRVGHFIVIAHLCNKEHKFLNLIILYIYLKIFILPYTQLKPLVT